VWGEPGVDAPPPRFDLVAGEVGDVQPVVEQASTGGIVAARIGFLGACQLAGQLADEVVEPVPAGEMLLEQVDVGEGFEEPACRQGGGVGQRGSGERASLPAGIFRRPLPNRDHRRTDALPTPLRGAVVHRATTDDPAELRDGRPVQPERVQHGQELPLRVSGLIEQGSAGEQAPQL